MDSSVKKLTEASILTSVFIVITMFALTTGIGYGIYLDFGVPIMFALIYFRCELKYTLLSGISSIAIILLILGNFGTALLVSQSFLLGIMCGYLLSLSSNMFDDLFWGSIAGVIFMVLIDIYARNLIGYSFMEEFQGYVNFLKNPPESILIYLPFIKYLNLEVIYYLFITMFPFGMMFSIYFLSLICGQKIKLLKNNEKRKYIMMKSLRNMGSFMCMSKRNYYVATSYIFIFYLVSVSNIELSNIYIKTIGICVAYLCLYFVIRDSYMIIGNYINIKYKNRAINTAYLVLSIVLLIYLFKIATFIFIMASVLMDKKMSLRIRQNNVINTSVNKFMESIKI